MAKQQTAKKAAWSELGTLRKNEEGKVYLVLNDNVKVLVKGYKSDDYQEVDLGKYRTVKCIDPTAGLETLLEGEHITEEEFNKRMSFIEEKNIKYRLAVPPQDE